MNNVNALIIIAKCPERDSVKTRLRGVIPDEERLRLYESLLDQTVMKLGAIPSVDTFIAFAPSDSGEYFSRFPVNLIPLPQGDLGKRMYHAFQEVFKKGYGRAALVGADIPDLSGAIITEAFQLLSQNDIVFGPARDGGYYLIGMKSPVREVFEGVPWSSDQTLRKSLTKARFHGHSIAFTDTLSDIDTIEDLTTAGFIIPGSEFTERIEGDDGS